MELGIPESIATIIWASLNRMVLCWKANKHNPPRIPQTWTMGLVGARHSGLGSRHGHSFHCCSATIVLMSQGERWANLPTDPLPVSGRVHTKTKGLPNRESPCILAPKLDTSGPPPPAPPHYLHKIGQLSQVALRYSCPSCHPCLARGHLGLSYWSEIHVIWNSPF